MRINFDVEKHTFASQLSQEVATEGLTVIDAIERLLGEWLEGPITRSLGNRLIKAPRAVVHPHYCVDRFQNLANLSREGYLTWYPEVRFSTPISDAIAINQVEMTGFELGAIQYGFGIERQYTYKRNELKTQVNHTLRLSKVTIPADVFQQTLSGLKQIDEISQPYIANLTVGCERFVDERIKGFRTVAFDHVMTAERRFCSCHAHAHAAMLTEARALAPRYVEDSWPQRVVRLLENVIYADGICHFCVAERHGPDTPMEWYGGQIRKHFGPYVDLLVRSTEMDLRTAKAEAKRRLSISRWTREEELCELISRLFPARTIRREASPAWLGQLRLDMYLPELALAVEHQGQQHYFPVDAFGGEGALATTQERDERKRALCRENGVTIVEIRFDEPLTIPLLRSRLGRWIVK